MFLLRSQLPLRILAQPISAMSHDRGRPLPKFGEWDVNNPVSADGFTVIFAKARDGKSSIGTAVGGAPAQMPDHATRPPQGYQQHSPPTPNMTTKWFCFFQGALKGGYLEKVQSTIKFGFKINEDGSRAGVFGDPEFVRASCEASLKRLDVDYIDLFYVHRIDTKIPIEVTVGELKKLVEEGKIKYIGLSEASPETIRRAYDVHPITSVQLEWSLWSRDAEESVIPTCSRIIQ